MRKLQEEYGGWMGDWEGIERVELRMGPAAWHHGGWKAERPLTSTGAQMSAAYVAATQIVDGEVMPRGFRHDMLERDEVWRLVGKIECVLDEGLRDEGFATSAEVTWKDGRKARTDVKAARGVNPELSNKEIVEKWRLLTKDVIDDDRRDNIEKTCLGIEELDDVNILMYLLSGMTKNPIA